MSHSPWYAVTTQAYVLRAHPLTLFVRTCTRIDRVMQRGDAKEGRVYAVNVRRIKRKNFGKPVDKPDALRVSGRYFDEFG